MYYNVYDKLCEVHRQQLHRESAQKRLLAQVPRRSGPGRRAIGKLGTALVAVGSKLEQFEHAHKPVISAVEP
jgi:hypothetical protein